MKLALREREGIKIVDAEGHLVAGEAATLFRDYLKSLAEARVTQAILNLKEVDYIDSTGLGMLVVSHTTFRKAGGSLKLLNLSRRSIELLVLTKLETVFEVFDNEQDAVNSFFPNRKINRFDILNFVKKQEEKENG